VNKNRTLLFILYLILIISAPISVLSKTSSELIYSDDILLLSIVQRISGLLAFTFLFIQIVLGSSLGFWIKKLGSISYKFHIKNGLLAYIFILSHPIIQLLLDLKVGGIVYAATSLVFEKNFYVGLGKISFLVLTGSISAAYFRTKLLLRRNWQIIHKLNYIAFFLVSLHSWNLGTDIKSFPFLITYITGNVLVGASVFTRVGAFLVNKWGRVWRSK
jgi:DMSO/TMAO reductase YedYZ heme-binding membrane subunit